MKELLLNDIMTNCLTDFHAKSQNWQFALK